MKLTDEQIETVTGYADGADRVMLELGIDRAALDAALLDVNIERCKNIRCGWYDDAGSMLNDDGEPDGFCENCRKYDLPSNASFSREPERSGGESAGSDSYGGTDD